MELNQFKENVEEWLAHVKQRRSTNTIKAYTTAIKHFYRFMADSNLDQVNEATLSDYRKDLSKKIDTKELKPDTANLRITVVNMALIYMDRKRLTIEPLKSQAENFLDNTLTETDYNRLIRWADKLGMKRERLLMECLAGTGVRIAELEYFTVDAINNSNKRTSKGIIEVTNKGKHRKIFLPDKVREDLLEYIQSQNIESGVIFHGKDPNKLIDKATIWRNLQKIAGRARVKKSKVHAHSFRHLFAKRFLDMYGEDNILPLADLLGHSSLETTRRYTRKTSREQKDIVNLIFEKNV